MNKIIETLARWNKKTISKDKGESGDQYPQEFLEIYLKSKEYTLTSIERMYALYQAVNYISSKPIKGDVVECGVWRGGSMMSAAYALLNHPSQERTLYLYDTFSGMSTPTDLDKNWQGTPAEVKMSMEADGKTNQWCLASLEEVKANLESTGYPEGKVKLTKGKVEDSIPGVIPDNIALLRLDTDFFESTYHELEYLYPRLSPGGVLIIDDYGHWQGCRLAVDQYFKENNIKLLMSRIDYTGIMGIKT